MGILFFQFLMILNTYFTRVMLLSFFDSCESMQNVGIPGNLTLLLVCFGYSEIVIMEKRVFAAFYDSFKTLY